MSFFRNVAVYIIDEKTLALFSNCMYKKYIGFGDITEKTQRKAIRIGCKFWLIHTKYQEGSGGTNAL